ncbi:hypothetical protein B7463_g7055, partial [Scytalidium lignicola]
MVSLSQILNSNDSIPSTLPPGLVAVFLGGTSGVGETAVKQFAKHAIKPKIYIVGRSQEAADRITSECKKLNAGGEYVFLKSDLSLLKNVDAVSEEIKKREEYVNLLVLSTGSLIQGVETSEGLNYTLSLVLHTRLLFTINLLPLMIKAPSLRRVVSIFAGTKEGQIVLSDIQARREVSLMKLRGHGTSIMTLCLEVLAKQAPSVSFIHDFPGSVRGGLARGTKGLIWTLLKGIYTVVGPLITMNYEEAGERQVFFSTSARFPPQVDAEDAGGVPLKGLANLTIAKGTDGKVGSGVYSIDASGDSLSKHTIALLDGMRKDGTAEKVWAEIKGDLERICERKF